MKKKVVSLIVAGGLLLIGGAVGFAASQIEDVVAQINYGISMKLNGAPYNPTEDDGSALRPLIYKGRTYLPVAALGKALGVAVKWDGDTSTVLIGETEEKMTDFMSITTGTSSQGFTYAKDKELLYTAGQTFDSGLVLANPTMYSYYSIQDLKFNVDGKYSKICFTYAVEGDSKESLNILGTDDEILKTLPLTSGINDIEIDISGQKMIHLNATGWLTTGVTKITLGDIYFK